MDGEEVIAAVQESAAIDGANRVAEVAAVGDSIIASEVAAVSDQLEDHQELSEERHEEILGDTQWLQNQMGVLLTTIQGVQTQLSSIASMETVLLSRLDRLESNQTSSRDSSPSIPPAEAQNVEAIVVVEPESAEGQREAETPPAPPKRKRRII